MCKLVKLEENRVWVERGTESVLVGGEGGSAVSQRDPATTSWSERARRNHRVVSLGPWQAWNESVL